MDDPENLLTRYALAVASSRALLHRSERLRSESAALREQSRQTRTAWRAYVDQRRRAKTPLGAAEVIAESLRAFGLSAMVVTPGSDTASQA